MNKKSRYLFVIFVALFSIFGIEITYIYLTKSMSDEVLEKKLEFVALVKLPDLAISTEATYVRHRTLSDLGGIYKDDGTLREYFPSTYAISHSHTINPIKKTDEK
jgi:hypothetical protein